MTYCNKEDKVWDWQRTCHRTTRLCCVVMLVVPLSVIGMIGCRNMDGAQKTKGIVRHECYSKNMYVASILREIGATTVVLIERNNEYPPTVTSAFTQWWISNSTKTDIDRYSSSLDKRRLCFVDVWGEPIVLITDKGRIVGLGSKGANKKWEDTEGDDISYFLNGREEDVKRLRIPGVEEAAETSKSELGRIMDEEKKKPFPTQP